MAYIRISIQQRDKIIFALRDSAGEFKNGAKCLDANGRVCLTRQQKELVAALPEDMREAAKSGLLDSNKWQEDMYKEFLDLADLLAQGRLFVKRLTPPASNESVR